MSLYRLLHRRATTIPSLVTFLTRTPHPPPHSHPLSLLQSRTFAFSSAEEAAAERRRRKRRLRIEPPLHALRRDPSAPRPPPDPNAKPLPDTTSALVGLRLNLHNRIQSLIRAGDLDNAAVLARQAVYSRVRPTVFTCNALVASMYRAKRYDDAVSLFSYFFEQHNIVPNVVSYNFLIATHCDCGRVDVAREYYQKILADAPFSPSAVTFRHLTKGLIDDGRITDAVDMLREMLNKGLGADSLVYNNLIKGFLDLGELDKANELFDELKERCLVYDGVVNATYMDWFFGQGRGKEAMESYRSLLGREFRLTPATCNVLLEVLLRHGKKKEAWELFDSMLDNHTVPTFHAVNSETFNIMVNECFKEGKYDEAVSAFRKVGTKMGSRPFVMDVAGYTNLVVRFVEHGMISKAEEFFSELQTKSLSQDVTCYRTFIDAYLKEERIDDALGMFNKMVDVNLRVIPLYANRWFTELIQSNKAVECSQILTKMGDREVKPDSLTYEIVIKGLVGVGAFDVTVDTVDQMMRYGVAVTPLLREYLLEAFEKEGRKEEMLKLLDERRQVYSQQPHPRSSGPSRPTGVGQSPRPTAGNLRPAGTTGYSGPAGATGYSASAGSTGFSASAGVTGYSGQTGPTGYSGQAGPTGYLGQAGRTGYSGQGGPTECSGQVGPTGYPGQGGLSRYPAQGGPTGYSSQGGPAGYSGEVGPTGYSGQVGPAGYSGQAGLTGYSSQVGYTGSTLPRDSGTVGSSVYTDPPRHTGYPAPAGTSAFQGPAEQMWKAGSTEQIGHSWRAEPPTFQGLSGPGRFPVSDRPEWEGGFQGPAGTAAYPEGQGPTEQADLSGSGELLRRYSGSGYQ